VPLRSLLVSATGVAIAAAVVGLLRPRRVEVVGESMLPSLRPGDRLLLVRLPAAPGTVVAVADPRQPSRTLVKRVAAGPGGEAPLPGGGHLRAGRGYVVLGDNPAASTDSTEFGAVPRGLMRGRAVYRYAPPHRRGAVSVARPVGSELAAPRWCFPRCQYRDRSGHPAGVAPGRSQKE
jgi:signal peptidase I